MKYNTLLDFYEMLKKELPPNTAKIYFSSVKKVFREVQFEDLDEIPEEYIKKRVVSEFRTRNEFSAAKNGLMHLKRFCPTLKLPEETFFAEQSSKKRNRLVKNNLQLNLGEIQKQIEEIKSEKLRLAYQLALVTGLRVSELENLKKEDLTFLSSEQVEVRITKAKNDSVGNVQSLKTPKLVMELEKFTQDLKGNEPLFFTANYMQKTAIKHGFECHDLRRIFAQLKQKELREKMPIYKANKEVQKSLRHKSFSTTKRYLYGRKMIEQKR